MSAYITPGRSKVFWLDAITSVTAPEDDDFVGAGATELTAKLRNLPNIPRTGNTADSSDLSSTFEARQRGTVGGDMASFELKRDTGTETEYESMDEGDEGFLVIFRKGTAGAAPAANDVCDVYPSQVNTIADGSPGRNEVDFSIFELVLTANPSRDISVVAGSS
jgi:hypothetical protein